MKRFIETLEEPAEYNELRDIIESKLTSEEVFQHHIVQGNTEKGKVAHTGTLKQMHKKIRDPKTGPNHVLVKTRHKLKTGDTWKKHMHAESLDTVNSLRRPQYTIKNTKTGQHYSTSRYQDDGKLNKIRKGGGDHKHAAHYKDGKQLEESQDLQAKMALDDAGIPWTMKRNRITVKKKDKKKAQLAWEKSFKKGGWPSLNVEDNSPVIEIIGEKKKDPEIRKDAEKAVELLKKKGIGANYKRDMYRGHRIYVQRDDEKKALKIVPKELSQYIFGTIDMQEAFFKVKIPDIAQPTFVEAGSESQVKMSLRKILRPDSMKELEVEKVTPTTMKKMYRAMAKGEDDVDEACGTTHSKVKKKY